MQKDWIADLYRRAELFPAMTSLQATPKPVEIECLPQSSQKLLIADDSRTCSRFLKSQLSANFEVLEAVDGPAGGGQGGPIPGTSFLSDMMMPGEGWPAGLP